MNKPFYASLRTRQQLGYVVSCSANELFGVRALTFAVQSATASPPEIEERIDEFVNSFRSALAATTDAEVATLGARLAAQYAQGGDGGRLDKVASRLWAECARRRYDFERPWASAVKARRITARSLLELYDTYLAEGSPQRRRLSTHVFAPRMAPAHSKLTAQRAPDDFYEHASDQLAERHLRSHLTTI